MSSVFWELFNAFNDRLRERGFITRKGNIVDASVHDSQALDAVTKPGDPPPYADSAHTGTACEAVLASKNMAGVVVRKARATIR